MMNVLRTLYRRLFPILKNIILGIAFKIRNNKISITSIISKGVLLNHCIVGRYSYIGQYSILNSVKIGNYSSIGPFVMIGGAEHSYWWYATSHFVSKKNVGGLVTTIGHDVWIGAHAVIKQGVSIGDGAVVGAGAVVLNDVEPYTIVVGVPSKFLKNRLDENVVNKLRSTKIWDFSPARVRKILIEIETSYEKVVS